MRQQFHLGVYTFDMSAMISDTEIAVNDTNLPYTMTVKYTSETKRAAFEDTIGLYSWDGSDWLDEGGTLDTETMSVTATIDHMTYFALLGDSPLAFVPAVLKGY